jgi:gliding motility-associated-like protein
VDDSFRNVPFNAEIVWNTTCDHISDQYYQIVLRAVDNFFPDSTGLATLKTIRIKVVGPAPQNLISYTENNHVRLEWDSPYICENGDREHFRGFSVWRKISSSNYEPDTCQPGLSNSPYTRIRNLTLTSLNDRYTFLDTTVDMGNTYCYRVQAEFAQLTTFNNPFNRVESLPSNETCILKNRDLPLLTRVSVSETDIRSGQMEVRWTKPLIQQYDTTQLLPPYTYILQRAGPSGVFENIWSETIPFFQSEIDTQYIDTELNTLEFPYTYTIQIQSQNGFSSSSPDASSVYLDIISGDQSNTLTWRSQVPWNNMLFEIFRQDDNGDFIKTGETDMNSWQDTGLQNGVSYCYKILATGSYAIDNIEEPLLNYSQINCQTPFDNRPPCAPEMTAVNVCDRLSENVSVDELYNTIQWTSPEELCPAIADDLELFHIYYSPTLNGTYEIIETVPVLHSEQTFLHYPEEGLSGCYYMTAKDNNGNESAPSTVICLENCPFYKLPNTFTPNGDGKNDLFRPLVNIFINAIDLKIFNQWGNLVYQTADPNINWDGKSFDNTDLPDGTYYYKCQIFEQTIMGVKPNENILSGHINIIRN